MREINWKEDTRVNEYPIVAWLLAGAVVLITVVARSRARGTISAREFHLIASICQTVVLAVEQSALGQSGPAKKRIAQGLLVKVFTHLGIRVPGELIDAFIEASVLLLNRLKGDVAQ